MYKVPYIIGKDYFDDLFKDFDLLMKDHRFSYDDSFPPLNLYVNTDDNACNFEIALTGYKKDWLKVTVDGAAASGSTLNIEATVPEKEDADNKKYAKRRVKAASFKKSYRIPKGYDTDKAEVTFEDGLLMIYIPVAEPKKTEAKLIEIH